tara:strand:+ start:187 stop:1032 length:846 start_codon:yes stop_codon:yes gene_type:complete
MTPDEVLEEAVAATGVTDVTPLRQGGQKMVFRGLLAGNPVILKVVLLDPGPMAQNALVRAHREVELLAAVDSPHLVSVLSDAIDIGVEPSAVVWLEEHLSGDDLALRNSMEWGDEDVFRLMRDVALGLAQCHSLAVVHRDLSPGNVRHTAEGRFVIMDPGFARHLDRTAITGMHQPGTPGFRTPEHVPGGSPTAASDIFGLGILAFFCRTGQFPVDPEGDPSAYDLRLRSEQAPAIRTLKPDMDEELAQAIDRCLQRQPARRFFDANELLNYLDQTALGRA